MGRLLVLTGRGGKTMNTDNLYPYLTCGGYQKDNTIWIFLTPYGEVEIKNANDVISCLIPICNGELKLAE